MKSNPLIALIVEDDPSWQGILSEILEDYGLSVDVSDNLEEAIHQIRSVPYRLAIIDLSLAGEDHNNQDGLQVLKAINHYLPDCSGILLTGYASVELAVTAIQDYGAFTCLRKENFRRVEFRDIIHQALASPAPVKINVAKAAKASEKGSGSEIFTRLALVVEDDAGWRSLLSELLADAGYQVNTSASYGEALGQLQGQHYQLAIVDVSLASSLEPSENQDGFRLLNITNQSNIPTIVVSGSSDPDLIDRLFSEHQVFAFLEKQSFERKAFLETLHKVADAVSMPQNLTEREIDVLALVAQGLGNKEIASELFITTNTVKRHLKSIFVKLEVNSRAAASAYAIRMGLGTKVQGE
jgi:DNA-binding NarL/FixJ family response regulator